MPKNPQNYIPMNLQKTNGGILENWIMHQIEYRWKSIAIWPWQKQLTNILYFLSRNSKS